MIEDEDLKELAKEQLETPAHWRKTAELLGEPVPSWLHEAASVLHGWPLNVHHAGAEPVMTEDVYKRALDAAATCSPRVVEATSFYLGLTIRG